MKWEDGHARRREAGLERIDALTDLLHTGQEDEDTAFGRSFADDVVHDSRDQLHFVLAALNKEIG